MLASQQRCVGRDARAAAAIASHRSCAPSSRGAALVGRRCGKARGARRSVATPTSSGARVAAPRAALRDAPESPSSCKVLTLHLSDSTIKFPVDSSGVLELKQATLRVFDLFKEKETWERPRRLDTVKAQIDTETRLRLSVLVNPNAYPTAFQAKVLFSLKDLGETGIEVATEIPLSKFKQDVDDYLKSV